MGAALLGAVPTLLSAIAIALFGVETRKRRLEEITVDAVAAQGRRDAPA